VHRDANRQRILSSVLEAIGNTPLVRLSRLEKEYGLKCQLRKMICCIQVAGPRKGDGFESISNLKKNRQSISRNITHLQSNNIVSSFFFFRQLVFLMYSV